MGPVLKTLLGLFLFVWTVVGIVTLAGGVVAASQFSKLSSQVSSLISGVGGLNPMTPNQPTLDQNQSSQMGQMAPNLTPQMEQCLTQELGSDARAKSDQNTEPNQKEQTAFRKCGFSPPPTTGNFSQSSPQSAGGNK